MLLGKLSDALLQLLQRLCAAGFNAHLGDKLCDAASERVELDSIAIQLRTLFGRSRVESRGVLPATGVCFELFWMQIARQPMLGQESFIPLACIATAVANFARLVSRAGCRGIHRFDFPLQRHELFEASERFLSSLQTRH